MLNFLESGVVTGTLVGLLGGLFGFGAWEPIERLNLGAVDIRPMWESAWVQETLADDPAARSVVSGYVSGLSSAGYQVNQQGIWVASNAYPIASHQGEALRPAASLTKVATTLAALSKWGPEHRFKTLVGWTGEIENGVILGDLILEGGDDPLFVWEEAIALGTVLQELGIRRVTGNLVVANGFNMNFETSVNKSGQLFKQALNASQWDYEVSVAHQKLSVGTPKPNIQIDGQVITEAGSAKGRVSGWLVSHDSLPLVAVLKAMNIYSNNPMAEQVSVVVGGPAAVIQEAEEVAGVVPGELVLVNGSGLGEANQMSPRAAVALMQTIQDILQQHGYTISDIFPVAGTDEGTLIDRSLPQNAVVKTGSLAVVSALAGAFPTQQKGVVWFSLINYGNGLDALRRRQDQVLAALESQWGKAALLPPELTTKVQIGQDPYQFGDRRRNKSIVGQEPEPPL